MAAPAASLDDVEIILPQTYAERGYPHDAWTAMRAEEPVFWWDRNPEGEDFWAITKHADITAIGKDPKRFISAPRLMVRTEPEPERAFTPPPTLIQMDNPQHSAYRKIIMKRFTPRALKRIHQDIDDIAKEIVEDLLQQGREGECDFVEKVAAPLPIAVIAWLLGVPKSDWNLLFDWTNRTIGAGDPEYQQEGVDAAETGTQAMIELFQYFTKMVEDRKKNPGDDLVSLFAHAEVDGQPLPPMDVLSYCMIIVIAGNETTRNATTGGMLSLIEHPGELRKIQRDPGLLRSGIEEICRWVTPIIHFARTATEDVEIRGKQIRKGDAVALFYPSANRDEEIFEDPFTFRVDRSPNRHLAFGVGEHFCAGAHVARLEMEMAYKYLLPRIDEIELAGPPERLRSNLVGGLKHLPIRYKLRPA